jgi:hypothetical protein
MRTTIRLPDDLLALAKKRALERGTTLTRLFEDAIRENLLRDRGRAKNRSPVRLTTAGGRGTYPGIDLDDTAALIDAMDSADPPTR